MSHMKYDNMIVRKMLKKKECLLPKSTVYTRETLAAFIKCNNKNKQKKFFL